MKVSVPIVPLVGLAFVILKLCNVIAWSWWWVLAPFWAPLAIAAVVILIMLLAAVFADWYDGPNRRRK